MRSKYYQIKPFPEYRKFMIHTPTVDIEHGRRFEDSAPFSESCLILLIKHDCGGVLDSYYVLKKCNFTGKK